MSEILDPRDLNLPGAVLTATGIKFQDGVTFDEWESIGLNLERAEHAVQWWIGDWLLYGEGRPDWGDKYEQAISMFNRSYQTLANYKNVAKRVDFSRRRENLSWTHHEAVASLPPEEQDEVLADAEPVPEEGIDAKSREEVRKEVRNRRVESDKDAADREARKMARQFERALGDLTEAAEWLGCDDFEHQTIDNIRDWWAQQPVV